MYKNFFDGYEAILFDLDGTIVNDEFIWEECFEEVFIPEIISENPYLGEKGQDLDTKIFTILRRNTFRSNISEVSYYELLLNSFIKKVDEIEVTPGFIEFADYLKSKDKKIVLVTNSDQRVTNLILEKTKLKKYFNLILTADDVKFPKPAPDIYRLALLKLQLSKDNVLVFEDSVRGSTAADLADLKQIVLLPDEHKPSDYGSRVRMFIQDFEIILDNLDKDSDTFIDDFFEN